jgi:hypothetical protein
MRGRASRNLLSAVALAFAFGVLSSVIKGNDAGVRDAVGNLSAPWVILPLLTSGLLLPGRWLRGALVGLAVTMVALLGFYLANAFVLDLGHHSTWQKIALTMDGVGNLWFKLGVVSGVVFGALGAWLGGRASRPALLGTAAALLVFEPVAWLAMLAARGEPIDGYAVSVVIWVIESALGLLLAVGCWRTRRLHPR